MTVPGCACVTLGVILAGTVVPLKPENVNVAGVFTFGGVQGFVGVTKLTQLGSQVQVPSKEGTPSPVMPIRSKDLFKTTFVTTHVPLIAVWPLTSLIVTVFP